MLICYLITVFNMCHGALGGAVRVGAHVGLEHQIEGPNCDDEKRQHIKRKT